MDLNFIPQVVILVFSVVFHEVAHGYAALLRGDTTARDAGRLTLNPIPHIDLFGTILLPLFLVLIHSPVLVGSAKPVPINPWRFKNPKKDMAITGAAGPASNLFLAFCAAILFRIVMQMSGPGNLMVHYLAYAVLINLVLAFFNLIPIPPLDGSRVVLIFLSNEQAAKYNRLERYGFFIVLALLYLGLFRILVLPPVIFFLKMLIGNAGLYVLGS